MRGNLIQFPKRHSRPELIDELRQSMEAFFTQAIPECEMEKSLIATSIFHFLVASKIALDHLGKQEESSLIFNTVKAIESNWPHYENPLDELMNNLAANSHH